MKTCKAKRICFAVHYGEGVKLNWKPKTLQKMEKHRARFNKKFEKEK